MRWLTDLLFRVKALFGRADMERDLDDEFAFHLEMEARKHEAAGMSREEAVRAARVGFGGEERFKESARESWGVSPLTDFGGDLRFAARQLLRRPAFGALATLTLALGIGGTVALFSVVNGLMLRPLPVAEEDDLVVFWMDYNWRGVEFDFVAERARVFDGLAAWSNDGYTLRTENGSSLLLSTVVDAGLFDVLGARPLIGRTFELGEDRPGAEPVVILSHGLWVREFGADREIVGRRIDLGGRPTTVIGVMPEDFYFPNPQSDVWTPLDLDPASAQYQGNGWLVLAGRVRDGVSAEQLDEDIATLATALGERFDYPDAWDKTREPHVVPLREYLLGEVRPALLLLLGAVGLVLLMACANVAALILTRTADRAGEMSVRAALGAGRARLARQVVTESMVVGLLAGLVGMGIALATFDLLVASLPLPADLGSTLSMDWTALASALALAVATGCAVSLAPMHGLLRGRLAEGAFSSRGAAGSALGRNRLQRALVVGEVLTAVVLATGAALLVRTVGELRAVDWGLDPTGVMTVDVLLPENEMTPAEMAPFYYALVERIEALPGVEAAGLINRVPVRDGGWQSTITLADRPDLTAGRQPNAYYRPVTPHTFEALGIEVIAGRGILPTDTEDSAPVAIVNESFATAMFPGESALGRIIESNGFRSDPIEIVGVVRNVVIDDLVGSVPMAAYYPWDQTLSRSSYSILVARTALDPADLVDPIRRAVAELDPRAALGRTESMEQVMDDAMAEPLRLRFFLMMFSVLGIALGTVGVYGVVSYAVQRRRAEFGIRMALGAAPRVLLGEVIRSGMLPVVIGVVAGSAVALAGSTVLAGFLFGVSPTDPVSLLVAAGALLGAGVLAALVPAWRASATDPATALRAE